MLRAPSATHASWSFSYSSSDNRKLTNFVLRLRTDIAAPTPFWNCASVQCPWLGCRLRRPSLVKSVPASKNRSEPRLLLTEGPKENLETLCPKGFEGNHWNRLPPFQSQCLVHRGSKNDSLYVRFFVKVFVNFYSKLFDRCKTMDDIRA